MLHLRWAPRRNQVQRFGVDAGFSANLRFGAEAAEERGRQTGGLRMEGTGLSEAISEFWAAVIS